MRDGLIQSNDAFTDTMSALRQIGMMPPMGSPTEQRMTSAFNVKTRFAAGLAGAGEAKLVAEGVWCVQGQPGRCNVYMIEDDGGVTMYDAGARTMVRAVASAGAKLGGIKRIVLGHAHTDHRGTAPALGVPVLCHPDEVEDAEGSGGFRYWPADLAGVPPVSKQIQKLCHRRFWDGGPVKISDTVTEGQEIAGFKVISLPGHAPGQIGLWRESDRLALVSDCFYTLDMWGRSHAPTPAAADIQLRHRASSPELDQAGRNGARGRLGRARQAGHGRRPRPAVEGRRRARPGVGHGSAWGAVSGRAVRG